MGLAPNLREVKAPNRTSTVGKSGRIESSRRRTVLNTMLRLLALGIFLLEAAAAGTPWNLFDFKLCKRTKLEGIQDNASGATYNPTSGTLWVITNAPKHLLEYSISGELKRKVAWSGFIDPEGLTWISGNKLAVVEEPLEGGISLVDVSPKIERVTQSREKVKVKVEANKGLEGLSYDPRTEHFFVVQELKPKRVLEVSKKGDFEELFNADHFRVGDFSGIHYAPQIQQLFILSQESKRVMRITKKGFMVQSIGVEGDRPEGLAFTPDGMMMFIVSEPNELTVYSSNGCEEVA